MNDETAIEKSAMPDNERRRLIAALVASAISAAGIGVFIRDYKAKKDRAKAMDVYSSKNAIVVPVSKSKFLEGVKTPAEVARSRGENESSIGDIARIGNKVELAGKPKELTSPDDIKALKRDIIRRSGKKVNYFKAAEYSKDDDGKKDADESEDVKVKVEKNEDDGRIVLRDQSGRFVSPTDPVAVEEVEKSAQGVSDFLFHPIDSSVELGKNIWKAMKERPVTYTAYALGSLYIAAKISDAINARRKERAKRRLEEARDEYVGILQENNEKKASGNKLTDATGLVLGSAFVIPFAITAMITNRIIENRKLEKKKAKEMSDSYPDDPIILFNTIEGEGKNYIADGRKTMRRKIASADHDDLYEYPFTYKTAEGKDIPMDPGSVLALISVKRAMIESAELDDDQMSKNAGFFDALMFCWDNMVPDSIKNKVKSLARGAVSGIKGLSSGPMGNEEAENVILNVLTDPKNNGQLLNFVKSFNSGGDVDTDAFKKLMMENVDSNTAARLYLTSRNEDAVNSIMNSVKTSKRLQDTLADRFTDINYADTFGKYRQELMNKHMGEYLRPGSILHSMASWFMNNTGIGDSIVRNFINNDFESRRKALADSTKNAPGGALQNVAVNGGLSPTPGGGTMTPTPKA